MNDNENSVFNVGSEKQISIYDLALLVKEICKSNAKIVVLAWMNWPEDFN